jgi:hypothetical protein
MRKRNVPDDVESEVRHMCSNIDLSALRRPPITNQLSDSTGNGAIELLLEKTFVKGRMKDPAMSMPIWPLQNYKALPEDPLKKLELFYESR